MLLIEKNNLEFELKIESLDDLCILSEFNIPEDIIYSSTTRKLKIGNHSSKKQATKIIFVVIKVKKTNFQNYLLRVSG